MCIRDSGKTTGIDAEIDAINEEQENITTISKQVPAEPTDETFKLAKGETLIDALSDRGVSIEAARALVSALEPVFPSRMMKEGTDFELTLDRQLDFYGREVTFPVQLSFKPGPNETINVEADEDGRFVAAVEGAKAGTMSKYAQINHFRTRSKVGSSLYGTAKDNKIPDYITSELTRVFSYDVDFQRQVKPNDTFEVFYGNPLTGSSTKRKVLHYAQLTLSGVTKTYYRYVNADGQVDYLDDNGKSASKALLKTPVAGSKLTSGFGMRKHPLLGYTKMHTGVDFGVPYGTPIRSAGAGVVEIAGRHGAYGVTVEIKHSNKFETLYAHMSKLADGLRTGKKVNQGQIIGYVGATGYATGPHLDYRIKMNGKFVNPRTIKAPGTVQLDERRISVIAPRFDGYVESVGAATTGTHIKQGDPLVTVFGQEVLSQAARLVIEQLAGGRGDETAAISTYRLAPGGIIGAKVFGGQAAAVEHGAGGSLVGEGFGDAIVSAHVDNELVGLSSLGGGKQVGQVSQEISFNVFFDEGGFEGDDIGGVSGANDGLELGLVFTVGHGDHGVDDIDLRAVSYTHLTLPPHYPV